VVFICHGNICRSPYAAEAFRARAARAANWTTAVESAGFIGPGRRSPRNAVTIARRRGIQLAGHRSQVVRPEIMNGADLVVVMNAQQAREVQRRFAVSPGRILVLGDLDPGPVVSREIADPVEGPEGLFDAVYARIDACLQVLIPTVAAAGGAARHG
jgi:protein-tyrosine phosphatase